MTTSTDVRPWQGVPAEHIAAWRDIFDASTESLDLSAPCPVCGARTLHRWYSIEESLDRVINGRQVRGRGGLWQWCSTCRSYVHARATVPAWWSSDLQVDGSRLTAEPQAIEEARLQAAR